MTKWMGSLASSLAVVAALVMAAGCSGQKDSAVERTAQPLTATEVDRILQCEAPTSDWAILNGQPGTLSSSSTASQGTHALAIQPRGWVPVQSVPISSLGSRVGTALQLDVQFQGTQANPYWWGTLSIAVDIPSASVQASQNGTIVNSFDLTNRLSNGWTTLSFDVPPALQTLLSGTYSDLRFTITLNVQNDSTGTYLIDNLRFLGGTSTTPDAGSSIDAQCPEGGADGDLGTPGNLATAVDDGEVGLTWNAVPGATSYTIRRGSRSGGPYTDTFSAPAPSYVDRTVINGATYYYVVSAQGACGGSANSAEATATPVAATWATVSIPLPKGVTRDAVALGAADSLRVNDRGKILDIMGDPVAVSNAGQGDTKIGSKAKVGSVTSIAPVVLRSDSTVAGDLKVSGEPIFQAGASVKGRLIRNAVLTPTDSFSWSVRMPVSDAEPVLLQPDTPELAIDPGAYGEVRVNSRAKLRLRTGLYFMTSLDLEREGQLILDKTEGPIVIYVTGAVILRGELAGQGPEGDFLLVALGSENLFVEQIFTGTIVAPNAKLILATMVSPFRGTFYAREIESHQDNTVVAVPFDWTKTFGNCVQRGCPSPDPCHLAGVCDSATGVCSNPLNTDEPSCLPPPLPPPSSGVTLRMDGVVKQGDKYIALFGYDSTNVTEVGAASNKVFIKKSGVQSEVLNPNPAPPSYFRPGSHPGTFLATFQDGEEIGWVVDKKEVWASKESQQPATEAIGTGGLGVRVGDELVTIVPDLAPFAAKPADPVDAQNGEPPIGGEFNGVLRGALSVSQTGAATYTVPISIPPGVAGMAPNLSLVYNSQAGPGIAGEGWSLGGVSIIHRCPKTFVTDGRVQPVLMTDIGYSDEDGDGVCLDGKRLIPLSDGTFTTELAEFSKIEFNSVSDSFMITTKSGEVRRYGRSESARVRLPAHGSEGSSGPNVTVLWGVDWVGDSYGNYYTLHYNTDIAERGFLVTEIRYTGHSPDSSGKNGVNPFQTVSFDYVPRKRAKPLRFRESTIRPNNALLASITTSAGKYSLTYNQSLGGDVLLPDYLDRIEYCSAADPQKCVEPLTFTWSGGGFNYDWEAPEGYKLPTDTTGPGTRFVDLDGDGLQDYVVSIEGAESKVWRNTGSGWEEKPGWTLPAQAFLGHHNNGQILDNNSVFVDLDHDGRPDFVARQYRGEICNESRTVCARETGVWYNRLPGQWVAAPLLAADRTVDEPDAQFVDIDGDGNAELVLVTNITERGSDCIAGPGDDCRYSLVKVKILRPTANGWLVEDDGNHVSDWDFAEQGGNPTKSLGYAFAYENGTARWQTPSLEDVNRDGLLDLVAPDGVAYALNMGQPGKGFLHSRWKIGDGAIGKPKFRAGLGDVDGDGVYDEVIVNTTEPPDSYDPSKHGEDWPEPIPNTSSAQDVVFRGDLAVKPEGSGGLFSSSLSRSTFFSLTGSHYSLNPYLGNSDLGRFQLVDINRDGFADVVVTYNNGGYLLVNSGTLWAPRDPGNQYRRLIPTALMPELIDYPVKDFDDPHRVDAPFDVFMDLNGDGVPDRIQALPKEKGAKAKGTWLNPYKPPVIIGFPNGMARETEVEYAVLSTPAARAGTDPVYADTGDTSVAAVASVPLNLVKEVRTGTGTGNHLSTRYRYRDYRVSKGESSADGFSQMGRGSQGFKEVIVTDPTGTVTTTRYSQEYPFTGMPETVRRSLDGVDLSQTVNHYAVKRQMPGNTALFVYADRVEETTYVLSSSKRRAVTVQTTTTSTFDNFGNLTEARVRMESGGEVYETYTRNTYGDPGSKEELRGKVTHVEKAAQKLAPVDEENPERNAAITHITDHEYAATTLGLLKTKSESGKGAPIEVHTAYRHDRFGNVIVTTVCASDFDACTAGAMNPRRPDDPLAADASSHPEFRTTTVSYDPDDFDAAPAGVTGRVSTLTYPSAGLFPVKTVNAAGHVTYSAYDVNLGVMVQSTDSNGIHTCSSYDALGWRTGLTERCGSSSAQTTSFARALVGRGDLQGEGGTTMTVTRAPDGNGTWVVADALGQTVRIVTLGFDGRWVNTSSQYDDRGRLIAASKPHYWGDAAYWTYTGYDWLGRPSQQSQELGEIDSSGEPRVVTSRWQYEGLTTFVFETVAGRERVRKEVKNTIGKLASVGRTDVDGITRDMMSFTYDADGNLVESRDIGGNAIHTYYDLRGRKWKSVDPDLGTWTYAYDGFGDLIAQTDAKEDSTLMAYDTLGRLIRKKDPEGGISEWTYDPQNGHGLLASMVSAPDPKLMAPCSIPGKSEPENRVVRSYTYTEYAEVAQVAECTNGETFLTDYEYDALRRRSVIRYPGVGGERFAVQYNYTTLGHLHYLDEPSVSNSTLWVAEAMSASGQVTEEQTRNGVKTVSVVGSATGWLRSRQTLAAADGNASIQSLQFDYDEAGNLAARSRSQTGNLANSTETFTYDRLDRVTGSRVSVPALSYDVTEGFDYDVLGNLILKDGKDYAYTGCASGGGPHSVCRVGSNGQPFSYDANGAMTSGNGRTVVYDYAHKPRRIETEVSGSGIGGAVEFIYGADGHRVMQSAVGSGGADHEQTLYVGLSGAGKSIYERTTRGGTVEHAHFIYAGGAHGGNAFALNVTTVANGASSNATKYYHFDHLGSVTAMTDDSGRFVGAAGGSESTVLGYDPWGRRRNADGSSATFSLNLQVGRREYTGHEAIPGVGLVNMNGRVYDPQLGRFLSADPNIQSATDLQGYNRYSYALNNPLRYTDPTGYWAEFLDSDAFSNFTKGLMMGIGVTAFCATGVGCLAAVGAVALINATTVVMNGGSFQQAAFTLGVGALTGYVGGVVGGAIAGAGGSGLSALLGGAMSGAISTALSAPVVGTEHLGRDMLLGALSGAVNAALVCKIRGVNPFSVRSAREQQGASEPSFESDEDRGTLYADNGSGRRPLSAKEVRARIASVAADHVGETDGWGNGDTYKNRGFKIRPPSWKCNCLVYEVLQEAGAVAPTTEEGLPLTTNQWARAKSIPGFVRVTAPADGDIATFPMRPGIDYRSGHMGIVNTSGPDGMSFIAVHGGRVTWNNDFINPGGGVQTVYWRWVGGL